MQPRAVPNVGCVHTMHTRFFSEVTNFVYKVNRDAHLPDLFTLHALLFFYSLESAQFSKDGNLYALPDLILIRRAVTRL